MHIKSIILLALVLLLSITNAQTQDQDKVQVEISGYSHDIYSGSLNINPLQAQTIQYMLFESQDKPHQDPLVLWLSGGPGCSSFMAAHYENGPYIFLQDKVVFKLNEYAWNKNANLLYFQSPQGIGFSQGKTAQFNDQTAMEATYSALLAFYQRFEGYKQKELYLSGSGYSGLQIVELSRLILAKAAEGEKINLKGVLLGNPCIKPEECGPTASQKQSIYHYNLLCQHQFYSVQTCNYFLKLCADNYNSFACYQQRQLMDLQFNNTGVSPFNIKQKCEPEQSRQNFALECHSRQALEFFLNDKAVKNVYHLPMDKTWQACNANIYEDYITNINAYKILPQLIQQNIPIWVYSADLDSTIPIIGTRQWIRELQGELGLQVLQKERTWIVPQKRQSKEAQIGGQIYQLKGLTFTSVTEAGFRAAKDRPDAILAVLSAFLGKSKL